MSADFGSYSVSNFIPFTDEVYFRLFARQFEACWPAHPILLLLGIATLVLAFLGKIRATALALSLPLAASAVTFHFQLYAELTPVGKYFGWAFLIQITLILIWAFTTKSRQIFRPTLPSVTGALIALFALTYPILSIITERDWPAAEYFGMAPDPSICFTLGILLICARPAWFLLLFPIPLLWAAVSGATHDALGAPHAMALPAIAAVSLLAAIWKAIFHRGSRPPNQNLDPPGMPA